ncbi:hypothetical protein ACLBTQ_24555, partial [Pseudomonas aeruginosa]
RPARAASPPGPAADGSAALTLVAGIMRESCWSFLLIVGLAKTLRYLVLAALVLGWAG